MDDHYEKYYFKAVYYLKFRQRSVREIQDYLEKKKTPPEIIARVIEQLQRERFLDDHEFARQWVESRARFKPKGKRVVQMELRQKGISQEIIDEIMQEERSEDVPSEVEQINTIVSQRIDKYRELPRQEIYQKLGAYLGRRGFSWDQIKKSIDAALSSDSNRD